MIRHYETLLRFLKGRPGLSWLPGMVEESETLLGIESHGDLPGWTAALASLPDAEELFEGHHPAPVLGGMVADRKGLKSTLLKLHPWRKGPLKVGGLRIDTEWRSDLKWDRLAGHLDLRGQRVLDIGCGNGYYGWRMLGAGAECVIGIDPTLVYVMQWMACRHFAGEVHNYVLPLGVEKIPEGAGGFDSVFSMGELYHRKDPVRHLRRIGKLARPGGTVILETLILEGTGREVLIPEGRYARMRNVWAVPSLDQLMSWMREAGLKNVKLLDISHTREKEQRSTEWMYFESLRECLEPGNPRLTVEGYPAPVRAALVAQAGS